MEIFTTYIYQPFFNILVGMYWLVGQVMGKADMGIAVMLFAIIVRIILLPFDFLGNRSADEKADIIKKLNQAKIDFRNDPIKLREFQKRIMRSKPSAVFSEIFMIVIQLIIILMLYRIFTTGLEGADLHLLYSFMPQIQTPINLIFLDRFDLSQTNWTLNLLQSLAIFTLEGLHMLLSPQPSTRREFLSLAVFLPVVSFLLFMFLPAGKKVFIITTLCFSILLTLVKQLNFWYHTWLKSTQSSVPDAGPTPSTTVNTQR